MSRKTPYLTRRERDVLCYVSDCLASWRMAPTLEEMAAEFHWVARVTAHEKITSLVRKGYLNKVPRVARGLSMTRRGELAVYAASRNSLEFLRRAWRLASEEDREIFLIDREGRKK